MLDCIALVIGVGAYKHLPPIKCAGFEAKLVFGSLQDLATNAILRHDQENGYDSEDGLVVTEADRGSLLGAIGMFQDLLEQHSGRCWAFFFYAGHGMTDGGSHYLLPNDAPPMSAYGICFEEQLLGPMRRHAVASMAVLDACRRPAVGGPSRPTTAGPTLTFDFGWGASNTGAGWTRPSSGLRDSRHQLPLSRGSSHSGGAYVCWATSPYQPTLLMSEYTSQLVKCLFGERMSVLKAASLAFERLEAAGQGPRGEMMGFIGPALVKPLDEWRHLDEAVAVRSLAAAGSAAEQQQEQQEQQATPLVANWLATVQRQQLTGVSTAVARMADVAEVVRLLDSPEPPTRRAAARTLWCLSVNPANTVTITQTGGVNALVGLLAGGSGAANGSGGGADGDEAVEQQRVAAGALAALAVHDESEVAVAQAGGVAPLVALLAGGGGSGGSSADAVVRQRAALALWELARNASNRTAIVRAGGIPALVGLLGSADTTLQLNAAGVLALLAAGSGANQAAIARAGGIPPLVGLLASSSNTAVQGRAAAALWSLAESAGNRAAIEAAGAMPLLNTLREIADDVAVAVAAGRR